MSAHSQSPGGSRVFMSQPVSTARSRFRRILPIAVALLLLGVVVGIGLLVVLWGQHNQTVVLPAPTGSYPVGRVEYDWTDSSREETLGPDPTAHRELAVWIWYPASVPSDASPADYLPENWRRAEDAQKGIAAAFFTQNLADVQAHAVANAALASSDRPFPVLVMQPGLGPIATDYTTLAEDLASHGYVVVASTPTYSANVVVFPDGRTAVQSAAGSIPDNASPDEARGILDPLMTVWSGDNRFVMDQIEALDTGAPGGRFTGRLDLQSIGIWGHSFGGASAAQTCRLDDRCKAGADLDGMLYGDVIQVGLLQPFMFVWSETPDSASASYQQTTRDVQAVFEKLTHGGYQITIQGTRHFNFSDDAVFYEPAMKALGALGPIDGRRGLRITGDYLIAFFDRYLKGIESPLLGGPSSDYPEVQFVSR